MMKTRLAIGAIGVMGLLFGVFGILKDTDQSNPIGMAKWLVAALILNDGVLVPIVALLGLVLTKFVPPGIRSYVQGFLVAAAVITAVALPMIYRQGKNRPGQTLLERNYTANLLIILGVVAAVTVASYAVSIARSAARQSSTNDLPPEDHESTTS